MNEEDNMRVVIIGGVAGGPSAAMQVRRNDKEAEIVVYEEGSYISYAGCGMPYYLGEVFENISIIEPRKPDYFKNRNDVDFHIRHRMIDLDSANKRIKLKNIDTGEIYDDHYDKLIISTGARASLPPIKGIEKAHVFALRNMHDMYKIDAFISSEKPQSAVIIGSGAVGLEVCENLFGLGMEVSVVERFPQVTPNMDKKLADKVQAHIESKGVRVITEQGVSEIEDEYVILSSSEKIKADLVITATGIAPNTDLFADAGIELGIAGSIHVNKKMETNIEDIYACGDCAENINFITGQPTWKPLGTTANKTGVVAGSNASGGNVEFDGVLGTGIFKVFDMVVASTGLSIQEAENAGYTYVIAEHNDMSKPRYMGGSKISIMAWADVKTGSLLGAQVVGKDGVDKRIDVIATAIRYGAKVEDLFYLDLSYSPPFSLVRDPLMYIGVKLQEEIDKVND